MPYTVRPDTRIHYTVTGSGPPIILGHSFLCSGDMWAPQVGPLAESYTVINVDARGHGESDPAPPGSAIRDMLGDMIGVLDDLGVESAVWGGLSMGGMVAMRAALEVPARVDGLMLLDTDAGVEDAQTKREYRFLLLILRVAGVWPVLGQVSKLMLGKTTLRENRELVADYRKRFKAIHVPSILSMAPGIFNRDDLGPRLTEIDVPALVLVGAEDIALPPERARRISEGLTDATYVEIEGAGHLSTVERPDAVTRAMLEFLSDLDGF
jgi:3-oxoadipate enol-lactonase